MENADQKVALKVDYEVDDFYNLNKVILLKRFGGVKLLIYILLFLFLFMRINASSSDDSSLLNNVIALVLFIVVLIIIGPIILKKEAKKNFKGNKEFQYAIDYIINEEGISGRSVTADFHRDWSYFSKFVETKYAFVLFLSNNTVNYLPKRCFMNEDDINTARIIFKNKVHGKSIR